MNKPKILLITVFYLIIGVNNTYATCSDPTLFVRNSRDDFTYDNAGSAIVMNDTPTQRDFLYATAYANCSGGSSTQYAFFIHYYTGSHWTKASWTDFSTSNYTYLSMEGGVARYEVGVQAWDGKLSPQTYYSYYFGMSKTSSVSSITADNAALSWSLKMPYIAEVLCPTAASCKPSDLSFYLLLGTDPAILSNRSADAGEIKTTGFFKNDPASPFLTTSVVENYYPGKLTAGARYYWRIRTDFPQIPDAYFAGGTFAILPNLTANPPAPLDANPAKGVPLTFQGTVKNTGAIASGVSLARFCINNPNCDKSTDGRIGTDISIPAINPAGSFGITSSSWTPDSAGSHTIYFCTDVGKTVEEQDENDKCRPASFTVKEPVVTSCSITSSGLNTQNVPNTYTLSADAAASGQNDTITSYKWELGDNTSLTTNKNPFIKIYAYPDYGNLIPKLQITDSRGSVSKVTDCATLPVLPAPAINVPILFNSYTGTDSKPVNIAKSTNGSGDPPVWNSTTAATAQITQPVNSVSTADGTNIFLAYQDSQTGFKVIKSTNGGETWADVLSYEGALGGEKSIAAADTQTVFVLYTQPNKDLVLTKSTDGGTTWIAKKIDSDAIAGQAALYALDAKAVMVSYQGTYIQDNGDDPASTVTNILFTQSLDGGASWSNRVQVGFANSSENPALAATDVNNIFISTFNSGFTNISSTPYRKIYLYQSTNAGSNFTFQKALDTLAEGTRTYPSMARAPNAAYIFLSYVYPGTSGIPPKLKFVRAYKDSAGVWIITASAIIDTPGQSPSPYSSISATGASNIFISYFDAISKKLMVARSTNGGTNWTTSEATSSNTAGVYLSLSALNPASLPPAVITKDADKITSDGATLNSTVNPNNSQTTSWFRGATRNPTLCNDSFGTKMPSVGKSLGNAATFVTDLFIATGLASSTPYYFCAIAQNSQGLSFGLIKSFTTASPSPTSTPTPTPTLTPNPEPQVSSSCGTGVAKATGLVTTPSLSSPNFPSSGGCIIDPKAAFVPFEIPSFDDLKSLYYDQKR